MDVFVLSSDHRVKSYTEHLHVEDDPTVEERSIFDPQRTVKTKFISDKQDCQYSIFSFSTFSTLSTHSKK